MSEPVVVDASVIVDLLAGTDRAPAVLAALAGKVLHAPGHVDAEVLSALGRLHRVGHLTAAQVEDGLDRLARAPITRHGLNELLTGAWARREAIRLADALYVELADRTGYPLPSTDEKNLGNPKLAFRRSVHIVLLLVDDHPPAASTNK